MPDPIILDLLAQKSIFHTLMTDTIMNGHLNTVSSPEIGMLSEEIFIA